jgi:hypothetical protein
MKNARTITTVIFFSVIAVIVIATFSERTDPELLQKQHEYEAAAIDLQIQRLEMNADLKFYGAIAFLSSLCLSCLIVSIGLHRERVKKASVHVYRFGGNTEVVIHEQDLGEAWRIITGLTNAENLKAINGGIDKAFQIYSSMAELQTKQFQALIGRRGIQPALSVPAENTLLPAVETPVSIPTFQQLLISGEIAQGKDMILGFESSGPHRGSFMDIYSAAVAGESGSGKSNTLLYFIGSGIISSGVRFIVIDPHDPHPKALGPKLKPLVERGLIFVASKKADIFKALQTTEDMLDKRLRGEDTCETPFVLVLDELLLLSKMSCGPLTWRVMERISTEGRKNNMFMLASSQSWLAERLGGNSIVRDTLTSAVVHRIKPKQANVLLQDKSEVERVRQLKQAGEILMCPVEDDSYFARIPYTTEQDMARIATMMTPESAAVNPTMPAKQGEQEKPKLRELERTTGISYTSLRRYYVEGRPLKPEDQQKLEEYLLNQKQVESAVKKLESDEIKNQRQ